MSHFRFLEHQNLCINLQKGFTAFGGLHITGPGTPLEDFLRLHSPEPWIYGTAHFANPKYAADGNTNL